jgi:hypothetical protein
MAKTHIHQGISFPGRQQISVVFAELERQRKARVDVVVPSGKLTYAVENDTPGVTKEISAANAIKLNIDATDKLQLHVPMSKRAWTQMAAWLGIRQTDRLYQWLTQGSQSPNGRGTKPPIARNWGVWRDLMNGFMQLENSQRLVRVMADREGNQYCRAILSDTYNIVSNADFFFCIVEALKATDAEVWCARLSEDRFYGYAVSKGLTGDVDRARAKSNDPRYEQLWKGAPNDSFNAAMVFGNSETGEGGIFLSAAIMRAVDKTFHVMEDLISTRHVGKRLDPMEKLLSEDTIKKKNELFFAKVTDYVKGAFNPEKFAEVLADLHNAAHDPIDDPERAAEALQLVFPISEERCAAIRNSFIAGLDNSRFGLANAMAAVATQKDLQADTGFELEKIAAAVIHTDMETLYSKAARVRREKKAKAAEDAATSEASFEALKPGPGSGLLEDL